MTKFLLCPWTNRYLCVTEKHGKYVSSCRANQRKWIKSKILTLASMDSKWEHQYKWRTINRNILVFSRSANHVQSRIFSYIETGAHRLQPFRIRTDLERKWCLMKVSRSDNGWLKIKTIKHNTGEYENHTLSTLPPPISASPKCSSTVTWIIAVLSARLNWFRNQSE